jgi:hypothetical protein
MHTLKQSVSIRSQSALIIFMVAIGWLFGGSFDIRFRGMEAIVEIVSWAIPIFTLLLLVSYFGSGRQHKGWFYSAVFIVVASFLIMFLFSVV